MKKNEKEVQQKAKWQIFRSFGAFFCSVNPIYTHWAIRWTPFTPIAFPTFKSRIPTFKSRIATRNVETPLIFVKTGFTKVTQLPPVTSSYLQLPPVTWYVVSRLLHFVNAVYSSLFRKIQFASTPQNPSQYRLNGKSHHFSKCSLF